MLAVKFRRGPGRVGRLARPRREIRMSQPQNRLPDLATVAACRAQGALAVAALWRGGETQRARRHGMCSASRAFLPLPADRKGLVLARRRGRAFLGRARFSRRRIDPGARPFAGAHSRIRRCGAKRVCERGRVRRGPSRFQRAGTAAVVGRPRLELRRDPCCASPTARLLRAARRQAGGHLCGRTRLRGGGLPPMIASGADGTLMLNGRQPPMGTAAEGQAIGPPPPHLRRRAGALARQGMSSPPHRRENERHQFRPS